MNSRLLVPVQSSLFQSLMATSSMTRRESMAAETEGRFLDRTLRNPAPGCDLDELGHQGVPSTKDLARHFPAGSGKGIITNGLQAHGRRF